MNRILVVLSISTLAFASSTAYLVVRAQVQREKVATLQQRVRDLEGVGAAQAAPATHGSPPPSYEQASAVESSASKAFSDVTTLIASAPNEPTVEEVNLAIEVGQRARQLDLLSDPNFRAARLEADKQNLWGTHADTLAALRLSPQMADKLMELLADHQLQWTERPVGIPQDTDRGNPRIDPNSPPVWLVKQRQEQQRRQAEIEALLGDAKYREWTELNRTRGARAEVSQLERAMDASGEPLTVERRQMLIKLFVEEEGRQATESLKASSSSPLGPGNEANHLTMLQANVERVARSNERLRKLAGSYLSPNQMDICEAALDRKLARAKAQLAVHRALMAAEGRTPEVGTD